MKPTPTMFTFFTFTDLIDIVGRQNTLLSPESTLIDKNAVIGKGNVFYPNTVIECNVKGGVTIGDNNVFYPGVYIFSTTGTIIIGNGNDFGPAGVTIKANAPSTIINIGDNGRYCDSVSIMGSTILGSGSQVLGNITVQSSTLSAGGTFEESDPDKRAAVLKGFGVARNIQLDAGQVVKGSGDFNQSPVEWQRVYHPKV